MWTKLSENTNKYVHAKLRQAEVVKRCGMLSHLCGVCHLTPWAPDEMADGIQ